MSNDIRRKVRFPRGDAKFIPFSIDSGDEDFSLEDAEIIWKIQTTRRREDVLSLDDEGVELVNRDDQAGEFEVRLRTTATSDLDSTDYREIVQVTDGGGEQTTWIGQGTFVLEEI